MSELNELLTKISNVRANLLQALDELDELAEEVKKLKRKSSPFYQENKATIDRLKFFGIDILNCITFLNNDEVKSFKPATLLEDYSTLLSDKPLKMLESPKEAFILDKFSSENISMFKENLPEVRSLISSILKYYLDHKH